MSPGKAQDTEPQSVKGLRLKKETMVWIKTGEIPERFRSAGRPPDVLLIEQLLREGLNRDSIFHILSDPQTALGFVTSKLADTAALDYLQEKFVQAVRSEIPSIKPLNEIIDLKGSAPTPLIDEILLEGETAVCAGRAKIGKSALLQQMACSLASGSQFLGHRVLEPRRVLYIDMENQPLHLRERYRQISGSIPGNDWYRRLEIAAFDSLAENVFGLNRGGFKRLMLAVEAFDPDLVIIDSLRLFGGIDLKDEQKVVQFLIRLAELRRIKKSLSIILAHHLRKQDRKGKSVKLSHSPTEWIEDVSGSQALIAHVDSIWGLEQERDADSETTVFALVQRNGRQKILYLTPAVDNTGNTTIGFGLLSKSDVEAAAEKTFTQKEMDVWTRLPKSFRWKDLLAICGGDTKKKIASSMLNKMKSNMLVTEIDKTYTKVLPVVWVGGSPDTGEEGTDCG
jgi:RecA-family ATPase